MGKYLAAVLFVALLTTQTAVPVTAARGNDGPLADAGLDQTVTRGATVHLDATGSHDPDGELVDIAWTIRRPDGTTATPDCADCLRTSFTPNAAGTYDATVRVTDDDGATATDTLYVTVEPGEPPSVTLRGSDVARRGRTARYSAAATAGTANLTRLSWYVDGTRVRTTTANGADSTDTLTYAFDATGVHDVRVVATDSDDQTDVATHETRAVARTTATGGTTTTTTTPAHSAGPISDTGPLPVLRGPRVVTGVPPLNGTYHVTNTETAALRVDGEPRTTGTTATLALSPGTHDVTGLTDEDTARFPDNTTTVLADPAPELRVDSTEPSGSLRITATATDGLANLRTLDIHIDDTLVKHTTVSPVAYVRGDGDTLHTTYRSGLLTPGNHTITVTATDRRNQTTTHNQTISVPRPPELITSRFVDPNDEDRTAYDHRLAPKNYVAHHIVRIDLHGATPSEVRIKSDPKVGNTRLVNHGKYTFQRTYQERSDILKIDEYWASEVPQRVPVVTNLMWQNQFVRAADDNPEFLVKPSDPVIRYTIDDKGVHHDFGDWGIVINASRSFDPDGSPVDFTWGDGAHATRLSQSVGKADSLQGAKLIVEDGNLGHSEENMSFLNHYVPSVENVTETSSGAYRWDDSVFFRVDTGAFMLTKNTYENNLDIGLRVNGSGHVVSWKKTQPMVYRGDVHGSAVRYVGVVAIPAKALRGENPTVELFNKRGDSWNVNRVHIPDVSGVQQRPPSVLNETVLDTSYLVEKPRYATQVTRNEQEKEELLGSGYVVTERHEIGRTYAIEEQQVVRPAQYETRRRMFSRHGFLDAFVGTHPSWHEGAPETRTREWTTLEHEWRDTRSGPGTFTGETRRELVRAAEYATKRQYRHSYSVQRRGTRTVTKYRTKFVPHEVTRRVEICNGMFPCYWTTRTHTVYDRKRVAYSTTETYTYTVQKSETYWATEKRDWRDRFTGLTRLATVHSAQYKTQYRYSYHQHHSKQFTVYTATRQVRTAPPVYDWVKTGTTTDVGTIRTVASDTDRRLGDSTPIVEWTLRKNIGTRQVWVDEVTNPNSVVKTRYRIQQTLNIAFADETSRELYVRTTKNTTTRTATGYKPIE